MNLKKAIARKKRLDDTIENIFDKYLRKEFKEEAWLFDVVNYNISTNGLELYVFYQDADGDLDLITVPFDWIEKNIGEEVD